MKRLLPLALSGLIALSGCAILNEAYLLDQEYGVANDAAFDSQIVYTDYRYADRTPEGLEGINAEGVMDVYNKSFSEPPAKEVDLFEFGLTGDSGR